MRRTGYDPRAPYPKPPTKRPAQQDRAAAEALAAALRAMLESLPRCSHLGCPRAATMIQDSNSRRVCSHHLWDGGRGLVGIRGIEQAEAALAAWEARSR